MAPLVEQAAMVMASEVKFVLRIELSEFNYPDIHVYIASYEHFGGLGGHGSDLKCLTSIFYVPMSLWPLTVTIYTGYRLVRGTWDWIKYAL